MSRPRTWGIIVGSFLAVASPAWAVGVASPDECEPPPRNVLREFSLEVRDRGRTETPLELPPNTGLMLVASETGIDSMLEVRPEGAGPTLAADNPVRRAGPQRILLEPAAASRRVTVAGIGKEPARGTLKVSLVSLRGMTGQCIAALRAISAGDASLARAQKFTLGDAEPGDTGLKDAISAAVESYRKASTAIPSGGGVRTQSLLSLAGALMLLQDWPAALDASKVAETETRKFASEYLWLRARAMWGESLMEVATLSRDSQRVSAQLEQARSSLREVADAHARRGETYDQALAINNIGLAYYYENAFQKAIPEHRAAANLQRGLGEPMREAQAMNNLALTELDLAQFGLARDDFARALKLLDAAVSPKLYADILNNYALTDARTGRFDDALNRYDQALSILERVHSDREQARSLQGIGTVYRSMGDRRKALEYYQRALAKRSAKADFTGYLFSLMAVADGLSDAGRFAEAIDKRTSTLAILPKGVASARLLTRQARDQITVGALAEAQANLAEVIDNKAFGDRVILGRAKLIRAKLAHVRGDLPAARTDIAAALLIFREYQMTADEFDALLTNAKVACAARNVPDAERSVENAMVLAERLRRASNNPALRASLWQPLHPAFDLRIRLLLEPESCGAQPIRMDADRATRALEIAESSRARALDEFRGLAARKRESAPDSQTEKRRMELFEQIASRRQRLDNAVESGNQDNARVAVLRSEVVSLMRELDILDASVKPLAGKLPDPRVAIRRTAEMIPDDTAVIEYWLGETRAHAWLVSRNRIRVFDLGPSNRIERATQRLNESMSNFIQVPVESRLANARELHALIVEPMAAELKGIRTLYFVPDGALHQVAFAALISSRGTGTPRYLVDDHEIGIGASVASVLAATERPKFGTDAPMLIVADPVYGRDDARFAAGLRRDTRARPTTGVAHTLRGGVDELSRLTGSALEADVITALFSAGRAERLEGFDATRDALLSRDLARYRVIHLATHSMADIEAPQLSTVVLSTFDAAGKSIPGEVFAGDLLGRRLNADLVVLSGCDSSLGKQFIGEGLLGMRYAAHAAGAHTVVASLWRVSDVIGPQLMAGFYSRMTRANQPPVAALSQAMREAKSRRSDPALWGVFQVSHARRATVQ